MMTEGHFTRSIAQLVECHVRDVEAPGSSPGTPTSQHDVLWEEKIMGKPKAFEPVWPRHPRHAMIPTRSWTSDDDVRSMYEKACDRFRARADSGEEAGAFEDHIRKFLGEKEGR